MSRNNTVLTALLLLTLLFVSSCSKPESGYDFLLLDTNSIRDTASFRFQADFDSPNTIYESTIACRIDLSESNFEYLDLSILVKSPRGTLYVDTVSFPMASIDDVTRLNRVGGSYVDIEWPYRESIKVSPADTGVWSITLHAIDINVRNRISGMGFSYKKSKR